MADFDLAAYNSAAFQSVARAGQANTVIPGTQRTPKSSLDMTDFLNLMVTELTNQTMDATADTSDMLNQMVQMQMIQAITNMTDASIMTYAASLVGKEVTVGQFNSDGTVKEVVGTVTGTGTMNGQQVVFVDDKYYFMNEIMAVGRLPEREVPPTEGETDKVDPMNPDVPEVKPEGSNPTDKTEESKPVEQPEQTGPSEQLEKDEAADKPAESQNVEPTKPDASAENTVEGSTEAEQGKIPGDNPNKPTTPGEETNPEAADEKLVQEAAATEQIL